MTDKLFYIASSSFEAACQINIFDRHHPASNLHGHSYQASIRVPFKELQEISQAESFLQQHLDDIVSPLNYSFLNDKLDIPTDENISRWIRRQSKLKSIDRIGIKSTSECGADLDSLDNAHIWRRYRFEAAHKLPNVPSGHPCGNMHGHGFEVILHASQDLQNKSFNTHMGISFEQIDSYWKPIYEQLDYACLNDIDGLENPTSEVLANWIWQKLKPDFIELSWVTVYETHTSGCHYNGEQYRIWKEQRFESALKLYHPVNLDKHNKLHGHSYMIRLHLKAELDQVMGWTVDYGDVKQLFNPIYQQLDHQRLDKLSGIKQADNASLLYWIKNKMSDSLPQLDRIDLYNTPGCGAILCWGEEGPALPD
jgi:6-pyruvoyltetrahydropterin/6-carboxytetrahydropterin synthase